MLKSPNSENCWSTNCEFTIAVQISEIAKMFRNFNILKFVFLKSSTNDDMLMMIISE